MLVVWVELCLLVGVDSTGLLGLAEAIADHHSGLEAETCLLDLLGTPQFPEHVLHIALPPKSALDRDPAAYAALLSLIPWSVTFSDGCLSPAHPTIGAYLISPELILDLAQHNGPLQTQIATLTCEPALWKPESKFIALLVTEIKQHLFTQLVIQTLKILWENIIYNNVVLITDQSGKNVQLYRADPFSQRNECGREVRALKKPSRTCRVTSFLDLDRKEFSGCLLKVSWRETVPYSYTFKSRLEGVEVSLMKLAASRSDLRLSWSERASSEMGANSQEALLYLSNVSRNEIDVAVGGPIVTQNSFFIVSFTDMFIPQNLRLFAADPGPMPRWKTIFSVFTLQVWLSLCGVTVFYFSIDYFFKLRGSRNLGNSFLSIFAIIIQQVSPLPSYSSSRLVIASLVLYSLVICTYYAALLHEFIVKTPDAVGIETIDDIVAAKLPVAASEVNRKMVEGIDVGRVKTILKREYPFRGLEKTIEEMEENKNFVLLGTSLSIEQVTSLKQRKIHPVGDSISSVMCGIVLPKGSLYYTRINRLTTLAHEHGFVYFWLGTLQPPQETPSSAKPLGLRHLYVLFLILSIGYVLAFLALAIEVSTYEYIKYKTGKSTSVIEKQVFRRDKVRAKRVLILQID